MCDGVITCHWMLYDETTATFSSNHRILLLRNQHGMGSLVKAGLYRIWYGVNRLGNSGVHTLGDTSAFLNPAGQLLLTRQGRTIMDGVGIVFEFYIAPL